MAKNQFQYSLKGFFISVANYKISPERRFITRRKRRKFDCTGVRKFKFVAKKISFSISYILKDFLFLLQITKKLPLTWLGGSGGRKLKKKLLFYFIRHPEIIFFYSRAEIQLKNLK